MDTSPPSIDWRDSVREDVAAHPLPHLDRTLPFLFAVAESVGPRLLNAEDYYSSERAKYEGGIEGPAQLRSLPIAETFAFGIAALLLGDTLTAIGFEEEGLDEPQKIAAAVQSLAQERLFRRAFTRKLDLLADLEPEIGGPVRERVSDMIARGAALARSWGEE